MHSKTGVLVLSTVFVLAAILLAGGTAAAEKAAPSGDSAKPASAAAPASGGAGYKIAVVDMSTLMTDYTKRKEKYDALQKEVDKLQVEINAMQDKIEAAKKDFDANKDTMTDEERSKKKSAIESDIINYRSELEKRQRMIDGNEELVLKEVVADIQKAIAGVSEKEGYHLVLNSSGGPRASVVYHSATIDITSKVLGILNS